MNNRILFMIIDDQVKYLTDSNMDHREWFLSLGGNPNDYPNLVRGFISNGKINQIKTSSCDDVFLYTYSFCLSKCPIHNIFCNTGK